MSVKGFISRKRLFVSSLIQGRIMTRVATYWVVYHLVLWHTLFFFDYFQYRVSTFEGNSAVPFLVLYQNFCLKYYPLVFSALACTPLLLADTLKVTHRIAGPLYRFKAALESILDGERVDSLQLRDYDLLVEFQDTFNRFLKSYNELKYGPRTTGPGPEFDALAAEHQVLDDVRQLQHVVQFESAAESAALVEAPSSADRTSD